VTTKLADLELKQSRGLGTMLISTTETTCRDAKTGDVVARQRAQAIFY
jgi:hypothetical protein